LFVITPTFRDKRAAYIGLAAAACLELISIFKGGGGIFVVSYVLMFEIWFVAGMCIRVFEIDSYLAKIPVIFGVVLAAAFIGCRVVNYVYGISLGKASICLNVMGCLAVLMIICRIWRSNVQNAFLGFIAKYTMPIFLMHTIFSAVLRSALFKMGITSAAVHVTLGLLISFAGPIAAAKVMSYFKGLDFLLYPNRYIKAKKKP
jgi:membrane-bound acyltransferase YfiQ involved in biofilm formation